MSNRDELLIRFEDWSLERSQLSERESEEDYPDSGEWQNSDDEGISLLWEAIELLRGQA